MSDSFDQRSAARGRLADLPSAGLGHWPTPLHRLDALSHRLAPQTPSGAAEVWIKRDDIQSVALAGNKLRKFDLVLGAALADGADTLITTGAAQSNSARTGAAAAAACGMDAVLVLRGEEPNVATGNLFLDRLVGAETRFVGERDWREMNRIVEEVAEELEQRGRRPITAPIGCSNPLGTLGFARAYLELDAQLDALGLEPSCIVHTSTSGGTHAGLLVGRALSMRTTSLIAIDAGQLFGRDPRPEMLALAEAAAELIDLELDLDVDHLDIRLDYIGDGYGTTTSEGREAIELLATSEAIVTDPVYSAKGAAGLVDLLRRGPVDGGIDGPVVFWHTGGYHALFDPANGASVLAG